MGSEDKNRGRLLGGLGYLGHKLGLGVLQGIEGISDFIVGGVADLIGADEFADNMMKNDWTNYSAAEEWFNPGEGWQFAGDVIQNVGGMLPAIAVSTGITLASGGTAVPLAAKIAGSALFGLQAAGQSTSEAAKKSGTAGGKEWLYGFGSGITEAGIEALSGGIGGSQAGKVLGKQLGKSTLGKVATSFVGEGLEEVASDLLNPALKRVTGVDKEAKVDWGNIPRTFLVGGTTGAVMGGLGRVKNAAIAGGFNNLNAAENAQQLNERLADNNVRQAEGKKLTYTQEDINSVRDRLSKNLQKMPADKRQSFIEQNNLGNVFNEDGSAKPITLAPDSYNTDSYSASLKGREGSFVFKPVSVDSEASTAAKKAMNVLTKLTKGDVNIVLTEDAITTESGAKANGLYKDGIIYLDAKADNYKQIKIVGAHEVIHSLEGTKAYNALANYVAETISKDPALQSKYGYEKYRAVYDSILEGDWTETTKDYQAMTEIFADYIANEVLVNEDSLRRVTNRDANILVKLYEWVRDSIKRLGNTESELASKRSLRKMERLLSTALNESRGGVSLETIEKNAREAERTEEQEKTAVKTTGKPATVRYSLEEGFSEQVDKVINGTFDKENSHINVLSHTPSIYIEKAGMRDLPILMSYEKLCISLFDDGNLSNHYHDLGVDTIKQIPIALENPLYILSGSNNKRVEAILTLKDKKGRDIFTVIEFDSPGRLNGKFIEANILVTAFGAKAKYVQNKLESRELLYEAKNSLSQVNPRGQFPSVINENEFSTSIIRENSEKSTQNAKKSEKRFSIDVNSPKVQRETAWAKALSQYVHRIHFSADMKSAIINQYGEKRAKRLFDVWESKSNNGLNVVTVHKELERDGFSTYAAYIEEFLMDMDSTFSRIAPKVYKAAESGKEIATQEAQREGKKEKAKTIDEVELTGLQAQQVAKYTKKKVYSKQDAEIITNDLLNGYMNYEDEVGSLSGKNRKQVVQMLWEGMNKAAPGQRSKIATRVADYLIQHTVMENIRSDAMVQTYSDTIDDLKPYLHKLNLDNVKEDLQYHFGNNSPYLRWGKRKGEKGIGIDVAAMELSEKGYYIEAVNNVDIFLQINELYQNAIDGIKQTSKRFVNEVLDERSQKALQQDVAKAVLRAFDSYGTDSELTKVLLEYDARVQNWKEKYYEERDRNYHTSSVLYKIQQLKDVERGTFANASEFKTDIFKKSIGLLSRIKYRGNLNKSGTRKILGSLLEWYVPENPILTEGVYNEEIAKMLMQLADNIKPLTVEEYDLLAELEEKSGYKSLDKIKEWYTRANLGVYYSKVVKSWLNDLADPTEFTAAELRSLENVVDYFKRFIESYNKVYRNGKLVEAAPLAEKYIKQLQRRKRTKISWFRKPFESYMQAFGDPMTIARYYDGYEDGFFTESLDALRKGAISAVEMEQALQEPLEKFYQKNKKFLKDSYDRTIEYQGEQISVQQAMLLYMTLKREQAIKGLAYSGFKLRRENVTVSIKGFATEENLDIDTLRMQALQEQETIFQQLNEAEREYISIVEKIFNEDCKKAKSETDILRQGYTNISDGYYVPIRRASIAQNVEKWTYKDELATISDFSFNKDTVAGAKNQLFIDSLTDVLTKHIGGISQYSSLALVLDSYNILFNLNISGNPNVAVNVKSESENVWAEGGRYFSELIDDIKGVSKSKGSGQKFVKTLRSGYAKYQLGANPKVWLTQLSSFAAATNILNPSSLISGFGIKVEGDVLDQYCPLAKIRNSENSAALAQGVIEKTGKIGDVLMKPIGAVDRWVIKRLFGACQIEVSKNGGPKRGTQGNLTKAGELLTKVILETQQNALATERSAAMRSGNEIMKSFTMFSADSMKVLGRVVDAIGESTVLRAKIRVETDPQIKEELKKRLASANKKGVRAISALVVSALFMASVALGFKWLYNKDDKDEDVVKNLTVDAIGNLFGGLPFIRDVYSFFSDGYEVQNFAYVAFNDLLDSATIVKDLSNALIEGKEIDRRELTLSVRKLTYASGQILGIPTRNMYNVTYGLTKRISPETAYKWNDAFYKSSYKSDLAKAIENEDDEMIATIVGLMLNENVGGIEDEATRKVMDTLITSGHNIIPKAVPDKLTYKEDEETIEISLTKKQKDSFAELYFKANESAARMVKSVQFNKLRQEEQAAAVKLLYDAYYNLAVDDCLERDSTQKNVLFLSAFDPATLATIIVKLKSIEADKDKFGKSVSGSRKAKVIKYIESLRLSVAQKYMILGYLGYKNTKGEEKVRKYISGLKISNEEKELLLKYSGYGN